MFEVGFTEIVLILGIALLVLGPARLPRLAADLGRWAGKARAMARQLRTQLEQEAHSLDPTRDVPPAAPANRAPAASAQAQAQAPAAAAPAASATGAPAAGPTATDTTTNTPDATHESKSA
jgi:Tat protein translocase TatB subunit